MIRIFSGIAAGIVIILLSEIFKKKSCFRADISIVIYRSMMIILTAVFAFLLIYRIEDIPLAYNIDEAGMAYDALNIVNYHTDRHLYHFPVYFVSYGDGQSALYTYLAAGLIRLFGYSILWNQSLSDRYGFVLCSAFFNYAFQMGIGLLFILSDAHNILCRFIPCSQFF